MKRLGLLVGAVAGCMMVSASAYAAKPPGTWDGLVKVAAKRLDLAYLQPGADFRGYTKVMLDPTEVAFHKNWQCDYNNSSGRGLSARVSNSDIQEAITKGVAASNEIFAEAWTKGGYIVVTEPGPDVLRIKTGIVNVWVNAPDVQTGRSLSIAPEAGRATFFVEARDSQTGALLGRAIDQRYAGDAGPNWRTSVSNRGDFRALVATWARDGVRGVNELKALSPIRQ